jgi:hypothetical protein
MSTMNLVQEKSLKPREPSLPDGAYRLLHYAGILGGNSQDFETMLQLYADIRSGRIEAAPSRLNEVVTRVLHIAGLSGLSEHEMQAFIQECKQADV